MWAFSLQTGKEASGPMDSVMMEECVNGQVGLQLTNRERGLRPYGQYRDGGMCERSSGPSAYKQGKRPHALWTVS